MGGKQPGFELAASLAGSAGTVAAGEKVAWTPRPIAVPPGRAEAHAAFVTAKVKDALWLKPPFAPPAEEA